MILGWLRLLTAGTVFLFLRRRWKSLLPTFLLVLAFWIGQSEYLEYAAAVDDTSYIGLSYVVKWGGILATITGYFLYLRIAPGLSNLFTPKIADSRVPPVKLANDGFDAFRNRKPLRNKAQQILQSKQDDSAD